MNRHWDETMVQAEPPAPIEHDAGATRRVDDETAAGELHFRELINLLRRRSRFILTATLCGAMLVFAAGLLMPPKYTAKAQIAIDPRSGGAQAAAPTKDDAAIETHMTMLLSRDHLERVLANLQSDPEFQAAPPTVNRAEIEGAVARPPRRTPAAGWLPGPSDLAQRLKIWIGRSSHSGDETTPDFDELERRIRVNQEGRSRIIGVSFTSRDPDTAATVANRIAELYVGGRSEQKHADISAELARLDSRIAELKIEIERSGMAVQAFMLQRSSAVKPANEGREADRRLQELEREAVAKGQLYHTLLRRQQEIRDQRETISPDARILSPAETPDRPSSPNPFLFIFPALIVFLICSSLLAVILEKLDRGLRSEREINEALGVPCIGFVPQVAVTDRTQSLHQDLLTNPFYAKVFRSIAVTMQLASPSRRPKVVLITSSLPGEGKTTLATSLSVFIARLRQRVLLIDLDFKDSSLLREFDGTAEQGILDLMLDNRPPAEVIQHGPELGLDRLPMNRCSVDPLILFASAQMPRLLHQLRENYDCVIIDSPPVLGSTETRLLAALADEILFVVKWGSTRRELAQSALSLLRSTGSPAAQQLRSVNAVITQVDLKKHARYGYGDAGEYFFQYERYSSRSSEARPAITSLELRISTSLSDAWRNIGRLRISTSLLDAWRNIGKLQISTSLSDTWRNIGRLRPSLSSIWSHVGRWPSKPGRWNS